MVICRHSMWGSSVWVMEPMVDSPCDKLSEGQTSRASLPTPPATFTHRHTNLLPLPPVVSTCGSVGSPPAWLVFQIQVFVYSPST
jgi:hypothetical protein